MSLLPYKRQIIETGWRFGAAQPTGDFSLNPVKWEPPESRGFVMVGMDGTFNPNTKQVSGKITYPTCSTFEATR